MSRQRNYSTNKALRTVPREQSIDDIAEVFSVHDKTVRHWIQDGCPAKRTKQGYRLNDGEVKAWLDETKRSTKPGRPPEPKPVSDMGGDKDYWLARKYKIQALEAEGEMVNRDDVRQLAVSVVSTFRNSMLGLPPKLSVQLEGLDAGERQDVIQSEFAHLLDELARRLRELGASGHAAKAA